MVVFVHKGIHDSAGTHRAAFALTGFHQSPFRQCRDRRTPFAPQQRDIRTHPGTGVRVSVHSRQAWNTVSAMGGLLHCVSAAPAFVLSEGGSALATVKTAVTSAGEACILGSWTSLAIWTASSMLLYIGLYLLRLLRLSREFCGALKCLATARRSILHGLTKRDVLSRHFLNGIDDQPHPYFLLAFAGWILFCIIYVPLELVFYLFARSSVFYYYYPSACGAGLMVEKLRAMERNKLRQSERQLIRIDWHRFKICVSGKNNKNRYCGESVLVNLPHVDLPAYNVKHWPWTHDLLRDAIRRLHGIPHHPSPLRAPVSDTAESRHRRDNEGPGAAPLTRAKPPPPPPPLRRKRKFRPSNFDAEFAAGALAGRESISERRWARKLQRKRDRNE